MPYLPPFSGNSHASTHIFLRHVDSLRAIFEVDLICSLHSLLLPTITIKKEIMEHGGSLLWGGGNFCPLIVDDVAKWANNGGKEEEEEEWVCVRATPLVAGWVQPNPRRN